MVAGILRIALLGFLLGMAACEPDIPNHPIIEAADTSYVELIWKHAIMPDTANVSNHLPILYQGNVGLIHMFGGSTNLLTFRNGLSGEKLWSWEDQSWFPDGSYMPLIDAQLNLDEKLVMPRESKFAVLDMLNANVLWSFDIHELGNCGQGFYSVVGKDLYFTIDDCSKSKKKRKMCRSPIEKKSLEVLFELDRTDGYRGSLMPPSLFINSQRDSLLVFQDRSFIAEGDLIDNNIDLMAFNLRTRRIEWRIDDIDPEGISNVRPPTIYQDKVYFMGARTIYCVTADSGKHVWKKQYPLDHGGAYGEHFLGNTSLEVFNNMLISHPANDKLEALDPQNGAVIWSLSQGINDPQRILGASPFASIQYKNYFLYSSSGDGGIFIHDLYTGQLVTRLRSPTRKQKKGGEFTTAIAVDPQLGHLYVCDNRFWYCYQLKL